LQLYLFFVEHSSPLGNLSPCTWLALGSFSCPIRRKDLNCLGNNHAFGGKGFKWPQGATMSLEDGACVASRSNYVLWGGNVSKILCDYNFFHVNSHWRVFNYKVVPFLNTSSMIGSKHILKMNMRWLWL
jgi:hypothetical protein